MLLTKREIKKDIDQVLVSHSRIKKDDNNNAKKNKEANIQPSRPNKLGQ